MTFEDGRWHPIMTTPDLVTKWEGASFGYDAAARWGADQELVACLHTEGIWLTLYQDTGTKLFTNYKELLKLLRASPGTATGDALRAWFAYYLAPAP